MIEVRFVGESHTELMLLVKSPLCDAIPPNVERAPHLLFSALQGSTAVPQSCAETPAVSAAPISETRGSGAASWGESLAAIVALRRKANPLYTMFGQRHGQVAA
jgi:hypothetical protein